MKESVSATSFSDVLKALRKQKKITQRQLAERLGVHYNTVSMWERGNYLPESKGVVLTVAKELGLNEEQTRQLLEASLTALTPYWNVPYQRNLFFTGRESTLSHLHEILSHKSSATSSHSCALCGLGGVGKTQMAIEYAYRHFQEYSAVFWLHAETSESLISSYVSLADLLNFPQRAMGEQNEIVTATIQWLNKHSDWLLIVDNVENIELIKPILPVARKGSFLFTTQLSTLGALAENVLLKPMTYTEGIRFLLRRIRSSSSDNEYEEATRLAATLGGLPLALDQAGAYIEETRCNISDYLNLYQRHYAYLLRHRGTVVVDHPDTVYATLSLCLEKIRQRSPLAIELLYLCAFFSSEAIPEELINEAAAISGSPLAPLANNPLQLNEVIRELLTYSLLYRDPRSKFLSIHRLVQDILKDMIGEKNLHGYIERTVQAINNKFPDSRTFTNWSACQRYLPHAQLCATLIEKYQLLFPEAAHLLFQVGVFLLQQSQYAHAEHLLLQALKIYQQLPDEPLKVADCLSNLAT
ncbi:MAG TPA: helix-turn-helix transcriptional regulator, partial [Ktedonobacteraceae bacterium]|nr:helix-turn-helix transcriptional regulator [Ktedonobacteraceae bacterium]